MIVKIAICDDEERDRNILKKYILSSGLLPEQVYFQEFASGKAMLENIEKDTDAVFLDIRMDEMNGKEAAVILRKYHKDILLVFFTVLTSLTYEICKVTPFRYIEKGFQKEKMIEELKEVIEEIKRRKYLPVLSVRCNGKNQMICLKDILYIERGRNKSIVYYYNIPDCCESIEKGVIVRKLEQLQEWLFSYQFGYPHNSYIVNIRHIKKYEQNEILLDSGEYLSVARSKAESFRKKYIEVLYKEG